MLSEETESTGGEVSDEEATEDGRSTADDVARELKEREDEIEGGEEA